MATQNLMRCFYDVFISLLLLLFITQICAAFPANEAEQKITRRDAGEDYSLPIDILSVARGDLTADGQYTFTIRLKNNLEKEVSFRLQEGQDISGDFEAEEEDGGVLSVSFSAGTTDEFGPWFMIGCEYYLHWLQLNTDAVEGVTSEPQVLNKLPLVETTPAREAVYETGHDLQISLSLYGVNTSVVERLGLVKRSTERNLALPAGQMSKFFSGIDLTSNKYDEFLNIDDFIDQKGSEFTITGPTSLQVNFTLQTSDHPLSGYFHASLRVGDTGTSLIRSIQSAAPLAIRPSNQASVIPAGFLSLATSIHGSTSANGNDLAYCRVGHTCKERCIAVGENISRLDVLRPTQDGGFRRISSQQDPSLYSTHESIFWEFESTPESGDADGITTFKCVAEDDSTGTHVSRLIDILATMPQSVVDGSMDMEEPFRMQHYKNITLSCTVKGRPLPDVTFNEQEFLGVYWVGPDAVTKLNSTHSVASKTVSASSDDLAQLAEHVQSGGEKRPSCVFFSQTTGDTVSYKIDLPDVMFEALPY